MTPTEELRDAAQNYLRAMTEEREAWQKQSDASKEWQHRQECTKSSLSRLRSFVAMGLSRMVRIDGGIFVVVQHRSEYGDIRVQLYSEAGDQIE